MPNQRKAVRPKIGFDDTAKKAMGNTSKTDIPENKKDSQKLVSVGVVVREIEKAKKRTYQVHTTLPTGEKGSILAYDVPFELEPGNIISFTFTKFKDRWTAIDVESTPDKEGLVDHLKKLTTVDNLKTVPIQYIIDHILNGGEQLTIIGKVGHEFIVNENPSNINISSTSN